MFCHLSLLILFLFHSFPFLSLLPLSFFHVFQVLGPFLANPSFWLCLDSPFLCSFSLFLFTVYLSSLPPSFLISLLLCFSSATVSDLPVQSKAYQKCLVFISAVGNSIKGHKISEPVKLSPHCLQVLQLLAALRQLADEVAPVDILQAGRNRNPTYRVWLTLMEATIGRQLAAILQPASREAWQPSWLHI